MRKDVLISLLAITGAPVAALADADVVIDKTAWSGDDLTVSEDGSVTVSTGKEVSIEKELAPGKYMLQPATFTDNAKIVAVYKGKEYAPGVAFTIDGDAPAIVKIKVRAVTPGEFKFSGVKFTLLFDFAAPVKELSAARRDSQRHQRLFPYDRCLEKGQGRKAQPGDAGGRLCQPARHH